MSAVELFAEVCPHATQLYCPCHFYSFLLSVFYDLTRATVVLPHVCIRGVMASKMVAILLFHFILRGPEVVKKK